MMQRTRLIYLLAAALLASASAPPARAAELSDDSNVLAYIRLAPPKELAAQIVSAAREMGQGDSVSGMAIMLSGYGYPEFPAFEEGASVVAFSIDEPGESVVIAAKLTDDPTAEAILGNVPFASRVEGGWTFLAPDESVFAKVSSYEELIRMAEMPATSALEAVLFPKQFGFLREQILAEVEDLEDDVRSAVEGVIEIVWAELMAMERLNFALDFGADAIAAQVVVDAVEGTALHKAFSVELEGDVMAAAPLIDDGYMIDYVAYTDVDSLIEYMDHILGQLDDDILEALPGEVAGTVANLLKTYEASRSILTQQEGPTAGAMELDFETGATDMIQVSLGQFEDETYIDFTADMMAVTEQLLAGVMNASGEDVSIAYEVSKNVDAYRGIDIHSFTSTVTSPTYEWNDELEDFEEGEEVIEQVMYLAIVDGDYAAVTHIDQIRTLIDRLLDGNIAEPNIAGDFEPKDGYHILMNMNILPVVAAESYDDYMKPEFNAAIDGLLADIVAEGIEPLQIGIYFGEGRQKTTASLSYSSIRGIQAFTEAVDALYDRDDLYPEEESVDDEEM